MVPPKALDAAPIKFHSKILIPVSSPIPAGIRFAVTFTHFCGTWSQYACTPRKRQCELRQGLTSKFRTVCSRVFSGESRELEHQAEGFDLRVLANVQRSRDDSRGGGGREAERIKWLTTPMSSVGKESEDPGRTARGNNVVMENWVLGAIKVRAGVWSFVMCAHLLLHNDSLV